MPDYDPKNIPILDDVIESTDNEKGDFDLSAGGAEPLDDESDSELYVTENNMDLFAGEDVDLAAEDSAIDPAFFEVEAAAITTPVFEYTISAAAEPQIGAIENINNEYDSAPGRTVVEQNISPWMDDNRAIQGAIAEEQQSGVAESSEAVRQDDVQLYNPAKASEDEAEDFESALIDYQAVDEAETPAIDMPAINQQVEVKQHSLAANSLQAVTDDIIKQLMPELEQQLRLLLKQALKEKLPDEIIRGEVSPSSDIDSY